jgi:uncharacterized RDD family membrane protein YckC
MIKLLRRLVGQREESAASRDEKRTSLPCWNRRLAEAGRRACALELVRQVCGAVRSAGVGFDALDAGKYLRDLDAPALPEESGGTWWRQPEALPLPAADTLPTVGNPVRRLVARSIDETLYLLVFLIPLALSSYGLDAGSEWFAFLLSKLLELLAEPLLLHLFGTTPGKVLMGLRLSRPGGGRLSVKQGAARLTGIYGCQILLAIPVVNWFALYRCLKRCVEDEPQPWDRETAYRSVSETYPWWLVLLGLGLAGLIAYMVRWTQATLPPNRGDLTVAEFAENVNQQKAYLDGYADGAMDPGASGRAIRMRTALEADGVFLPDGGGRGDGCDSAGGWDPGHELSADAAPVSDGGGHGPGLGAGGRALLEIQPGPAAGGVGAHGRGRLDDPVGGSGDHLRRGYAVGDRVHHRGPVGNGDPHPGAGGIKSLPLWGRCRLRSK